MEAEPNITRRTLLVSGAAAVGVAGATALAGCGSSSGSGATGAGAATASSGLGGGSGGGSGGGGDVAPSGGDAATAPAAPLAKVSDVPVGKSISATLGGKPILISQPTAGDIVAFSAICTHMGCTVAPAGKQFRCPCHGSVYNAATGAVIKGPAPRALPKIPVHVQSGEVVPGA